MPKQFSALRCVASGLAALAPLCFRIGSKFRCNRSTPTEIALTSEKAIECLRIPAFCSNGRHWKKRLSKRSTGTVTVLPWRGRKSQRNLIPCG
jgi:hypothetical protein